MLTVLDKLVLKPAEVCSFTFGRKCGTGYDPFKMWNITLPATPKPPVKPVPPPKVCVISTNSKHAQCQLGADVMCVNVYMFRLCIYF